MSHDLIADMQEDDAAIQVRYCADSITVDQVVEIVCFEFCITKEELFARRLRMQEFKWAKLAFIHIMYNSLRLSHRTIAQIIGHQDSSTMYYRLNQFKEEIRNPKFRMHYLSCMQQMHKLIEGAFVHDVATHFEVYKRIKVPRALVYQLNKLDRFFNRFGYQITVVRTNTGEKVCGQEMKKAG